MDGKKGHSLPDNPLGFMKWVIHGAAPPWDRRPLVGTGGGAAGSREICLNSIDADGTQAGYETDPYPDDLRSRALPVIASGGAGTPEHLLQVLTQGRAMPHSLLPWSIRTYTIKGIKDYLAQRRIPVRLVW